MTVYFNCTYFPYYTRKLLECLLGISPSGRNPCGQLLTNIFLIVNVALFVNFPNVAVFHMGFHNKGRQPERQNNFPCQSKRRRLKPLKCSFESRNGLLKEQVHGSAHGHLSKCCFSAGTCCMVYMQAI